MDRQLNSNPQRMLFLDAMRGFTMILVVFSHVHTYSMGYNTVLNHIFSVFRMPVFFFVSGFLAFTPSLDGSLLRHRVKNRFVKQLYPTVVIWLLFALFLHLCHDDRISAELWRDSKGGYWFTYALVWVFMLYALMQFLLTKLKGTTTVMGIFYLVAACALYLLGVEIKSDLEPGNDITQLLSLNHIMLYIPYFFLGTACRALERPFIALMREKGFTVVLAVLCTALFTTSFHIGRNAIYRIPSADPLLLFSIVIMGVLAVFGIFMAMEPLIAGHRRLWHPLLHTGRNTLPVYLLHYFIIMTLSYTGALDALALHLSSTGSLWLDFAIGFTLSTAIVAVILTFTDALHRHAPRAHKILLAS